MTPPPTSYERIAFVASSIPEAKAAHDRLRRCYGDVPPTAADVIVALGGDGLMLQTLHRFMRDRIPIFGMNRGSVGFLMNEFNENDLIGRLERAVVARIHPLAMTAIDASGQRHQGLAINEVALFRQTHLEPFLARCGVARAGRRIDELRAIALAVLVDDRPQTCEVGVCSDEDVARCSGKRRDARRHEQMIDPHSKILVEVPRTIVPPSIASGLPMT